MILFTIVIMFTKDPIQRAAYIRQRRMIWQRHRRHSIRPSFVHRLLRPLHSGHGSRRSGSGELGTSGAFTKAGNPRTGNRRGPRNGY
jgi:hypothetical protein